MGGNLGLKNVLLAHGNIGAMVDNRKSQGFNRDTCCPGLCRSNREEAS